jgi:predicted TIM-barrel fold metal-dependent hydrolase
MFGEVLAAHPQLVTVLAHTGLPDYSDALEPVQRYPRVHLDTAMVGVPFTEASAPLSPDWLAQLVDVPDRIVLGTDFPNIPYDYATQLRAVVGWASADDRLGLAFLRAVVRDNPVRLLRLER